MGAEGRTAAILHGAESAPVTVRYSIRVEYSVSNHHEIHPETEKPMKKILGLMIILAIAGCDRMRHYHPVVDLSSASSARQAAFPDDLESCREIGSEFSNEVFRDNIREAANRVAAGLTLGIYLIVVPPRAFTFDYELYDSAKRAVDHCLTNRGYDLPNYYN